MRNARHFVTLYSRRSNRTQRVPTSGDSAATTAVHICGARGLSSDHAPERLLRDALVTEIIEGCTEVHETVIGSQATLEV